MISLPYRSSDFQQPNLVREESKADLQWKSHIQSKNLVLCCSGLKETGKVNKESSCKLIIHSAMTCSFEVAFHKSGLNLDV